MTENRFDLVCAEIKRLRKEVKDNIVELGNSESERIGLLNDLEIYDNILSFIDSMKKEPISVDLEDAAEDYGIRQGAELKPFAIKFFKAGANWQKQQMMKEAVDVEISDNGCAKGLQFIPVWPFTDEYVGGDKVKVIIVKE